jgi:hypothetical protein
MNESWIQITSLFLANAGLILWFRSESRADWRHMHAKLEAYRTETNALIHAIHDEIKDFHGKLSAIEERRKHD